MGSGNSAQAANISIEFDKKYTMVYQTGELVSGTATFLNDGQLELKLKSIIIELVGEIIYITTRGSGQSKLTDIHIVPFFTEQQIVRSSDMEDNFVLQAGSYTWPFALLLVDSLPSSLEQTRYQGPFVRYVLRVQLIRSEWYKKNIQKACPIIVQSVISPFSKIESKDDNKNEKGVHLHALLPKNIAVAGEKLLLRVDLHNQNRALITRVSLTLIQQRLLGPAGKDDVVLLKQDLKGIHDFQDEHLHDNFEFCLPEKVVPSCSCVLPQWSARRLLIISYELHLEAHISGLCTNVRLRLPLTVTNSTHIIADETASPPSYEKLPLI